MKEDITKENTVTDDTQSILTKEALANTQEDIPDEWLEEATGGNLGSTVLDVSYGASRLSIGGGMGRVTLTFGGGAIAMTSVALEPLVK